MEKLCEFCGGLLVRRYAESLADFNKRKFCGSVCYGKSREALIGTRRYSRCFGCIMVKVGFGKKGWKSERVVNAAIAAGRPLNTGSIVGRDCIIALDGNAQNTDPSNLLVQSAIYCRNCSLCGGLMVFRKKQRAFNSKSGLKFCVGCWENRTSECVRRVNSVLRIDSHRGVRKVAVKCGVCGQFQQRLPCFVNGRDHWFCRQCWTGRRSECRVVLGLKGKSYELERSAEKG